MINVPDSNKSLVETVIGGNLRTQYLNEHVSPSTYTRLSAEEKAYNMCEYALTEYVNTNKIVDAVFKNKDRKDTIFMDIEHRFKQNALMVNIERSAGDITKVKHYEDIKGLLNYIVHVNGNTQDKSENITKTTNYALELLKSIKLMEDNKKLFRDAIMKEASRQNSKHLCLSFYVTCVLMIHLLTNSLYCASMRATFNYNESPPTAEKIYFELRDNIEFDDSQMEFVSQLNSAMENGKLRKVFASGLSEALEDAVYKISLNEGVMDIAFGLISYFKTLDLLILWPIYTVRAIVYWASYCYSVVATLSVSIERSIAMRKNINFTESEYNDFKKKGVVESTKVSKAFSSASATIDLQHKKDSQVLHQLAQQNNQVLI